MTLDATDTPLLRGVLRLQPKFATSFDVLDIPKYLEKELAPATFVKRKGRRWLVRDLPMDYDPEILSDSLKNMREWGIVASGDDVRVPLFPYSSRTNSIAVATAYAFELGIKAHQFIDPSQELSRLHITIGEPATEEEIEEHPVIRFWLGFAFVLEKKS